MNPQWTRPSRTKVAAVGPKGDLWGGSLGLGGGVNLGVLKGIQAGRLTAVGKPTRGW